MCHGFKFRTVYNGLIVACVILAAFVFFFVFADSNSSRQKSAAEIVSKAVKERQILYKLTTLDEFKQIAGQPVKETKEDDGGMALCDLEYSDIRARFVKMRDDPTPFTILWVTGGGRAFDIGQNRQIVLRDTYDLNKLDSFWGFANVSLANLDLREHKKLLDDMRFDSLTKWPEPNKLPKGFQPADLLEKGKNPGLGIRKLHEEGIDGRGIGIAIIDQPLLKNHIEYEDRIVHYEEIEVQGAKIQMHGPPVCSIAVGKTCGVAPAAYLVYYAVPMWEWNSCRPYCDIINKILELNTTLKDSEKVRVVSISTGMFAAWSDFADWQRTVEKAAGQGILIVPCGTTLLDYGTLTRITDENPDEPTSYRCGKYGGRSDSVLVPTGNRTLASHLGPEVYTFYPEGGMSWAAPYLAGLAILAFQVDPEIKPDEIVKLWIETAVKTDAGPVVNPPGFIEAVQKGKLK